MRGPKIPIDSTTISIANAISTNTPVMPPSFRKKPMMKLANTVLMRLNE